MNGGFDIGSGPLDVGFLVDDKLNDDVFEGVLDALLDDGAVGVVDEIIEGVLEGVLNEVLEGVLNDALEGVLEDVLEAGLVETVLDDVLKTVLDALEEVIDNVVEEDCDDVVKGLVYGLVVGVGDGGLASFVSRGGCGSTVYTAKSAVHGKVGQFCA